MIILGLDWIGKTWTGLIKHGLIKHGLIKQRLRKYGLIKHGLIEPSQTLLGHYRHVRDLAPLQPRGFFPRFYRI